MSVLQHFEEYQKARVKFVQAVAEGATRPQNIEVMNNAGVMQLLRPLLLDNVSENQRLNCVTSRILNILIVLNRFQAFNKQLLWHWVDWRTTAKIWLKQLLEMKFYPSLYILFQTRM